MIEKFNTEDTEVTEFFSESLSESSVFSVLSVFLSSRGEMT